MRMTVADLMTETPITVGPECTTDKALDAFYEYETPELYVIDKAGRLLGVLPDYELLKAQLSGEALDARVDRLMSRSVPVVSADTDAAEIARSFRECKCSRIPVVKAGKLIGIVTRADIMRVMAVLRRIDAQAPATRVGPKRPKHLSVAKAPTTRNSRAKSQDSKAATSRSSSKSARPRSMTRSSR